MQGQGFPFSASVSQAPHLSKDFLLTNKAQLAIALFKIGLVGKTEL